MVERVFGPCRDGQHEECLVFFKSNSGEITMRCSCECGHSAQKESSDYYRDPNEGVPI